MRNFLAKEIIWGLSMMAAVFGFGFHMGEHMFHQTDSQVSDDVHPDANG